ncbi:MAG: Stage V sporulation protein D [Flavobacteriales bacterium]|nr:MAG: Stage V sporulation protein D [Flavobacteriales bacterium]
MNKQKNMLSRGYLVVFVLFILGTSVGYRLVSLQLTQGEKYRGLAEKRSIKNVEVLPVRGNIYAKDGSLLATSVSKYSIHFDAVTVSESVFQEHLSALSDSLSILLGSSSNYYTKMLRNARSKGSRYQLIARRLSYPQYQRIRQFPMFRLGGVRGGFIVERQFIRDLPLGKMAERTIGYEQRNPNGTYVKVGLEGAYGVPLRGQSGRQLRQRIANGQWKPLTNDYQQEPVDGLDVWTTIDTNLQDVAHHALLGALEEYEAEHGSVLVMETKTGAVRAIANLGRTKNNTYFERLNYAVGEAHEPGSTFKLFALMAALEDKVIDTTTMVDTEKGKLTFYGKYHVRDSKRGGYGVIPVSQVFERSSNTGIVKLIHENYKENPAQFTDRLLAMGIDKPLGLAISGEGIPKIPHPKDADWDGLDLPWMAFGYGVSLTPLQTLSYYNAIANNGELVSPRFVSSVRSLDGKLVKSFPKKVLNPAICSSETRSKLHKLMEGVVKNKWGTAHNIYDKKLSIAGKTGTCQVDYTTDNVQYISSFVGYFPVENPTYSCIVVVHKPNKKIGYYGNVVAAPVFKKIAEAVIHNIPDESTIELHKIAALTHQNQIPNSTELLNSERMPDVRGWTAMEAVAVLENLGVSVTLKGKGKVLRQSQKPGMQLKKNQTVTLTLT